MESRGPAGRAAIRAVREAISVPLVANGDVDTVEDAVRILALSGADAVMVGRSAQGRPWHPAVLAGDCALPQPEEIAAVAVEHYRMMLDFYGVEAGLRHARKHVGWYLDRLAENLPAELRVSMMTSQDPAFVISHLGEALARYGRPATREAKAA